MSGNIESNHAPPTKLTQRAAAALAGLLEELDPGTQRIGIEWTDEQGNLHGVNWVDDDMIGAGSGD